MNRRPSDRPAALLKCGGSPLVIWLVCLLVLFFSGCGSLSSRSKASIDQLHLLVTSVALNLDGKAGADGVGVRVYASRRGETTAVPITTGQLEILMFEGTVPASDLPNHKAAYTWTYPADKLKPQMQETSIGMSYRFAAIWGENKPSGDRVTFVARYTSPAGQVIYSAPSSVPLSVR